MQFCIARGIQSLFDNGKKPENAEEMHLSVTVDNIVSFVPLTKQYAKTLCFPHVLAYKLAAFSVYAGGAKNVYTFKERNTNCIKIT